MKNDVTRAWSQALRSGDYTQIRGSLGMKSELQDVKLQACCLGVLSDVRGVPYSFTGVNAMFHYPDISDSTMPTPEFARSIGLDIPLPKKVGNSPRDFIWTATPDWPDDQTGKDREGVFYGNLNVTYAVMNDSYKMTFDQIADLVDYFGVV